MTVGIRRPYAARLSDPGRILQLNGDVQGHNIESLEELLLPS
jgi:hypothetical protein